MNSDFNISKENPSDEEIDLVDLLKIFQRRWAIIFIFIIGSIFFSVPYSLTRPKLWAGNFKIVTDTKSKPKSKLDINLDFNSNLTTQIVILESPLILRSVYDYAIKLDQEKGIENNDLTYNKWFINKLSINRIKGSEVLKITYKDSNKENILPILDKISKKYQEYSKSDLERSINKGIIYSNKQLLEFKEKSRLSHRKLDFYKMKYGISASTKLDIESPNNSYLSDKKGTDMSSFEGMTNGGYSPLSKLSGINQELFRRRQYFQETDKSIQNLLKERKQLIKYIETTSNGLIALPNKENLTKEEAQEIIVKYKELNRAAARDLQIVNNLENSLIKLKMDKAKEGKPWELISTPTITESPIAPKKKAIVGIFLIFGISLGIIFAFWKDISSGYIFSFEKIQKILPIQIIHNVYKKDEIAIENHIKILLKGPLKDYESIGLLCIGKFSNDFLDGYRSLLKKNATQKQIIVSKDITEIVTCSAQILITELGNVSREEIKIAKEHLSLLSNNLVGMILISSEI